MSLEVQKKRSSDHENRDLKDRATKQGLPEDSWIGILKYAGKWMEQGNIILSELTQNQKDNYGMHLLICRC